MTRATLKDQKTMMLGAHLSRTLPGLTGYPLKYREEPTEDAGHLDRITYASECWIGRESKRLIM